MSSRTDRPAGALLPWRDVWLPAATAVAMAVALWLVFVVVPSERVQGTVQRIFYFHVHLAWMAFGGFVVTAGASVAYLARGQRAADRLAEASAEVGLLYTTLVLVTGPLWARPIWGVWWTWDPRLTMTVVLWAIYASYLMLRRLGGRDEVILRYAAVLGVVGVLDIPLLIVAIRLWRGVHPAVLLAKDADAGLADPMMVQTLIVAGIALALLFAWLVVLRMQFSALDDEVEALSAEVAT